VVVGAFSAVLGAAVGNGAAVTPAGAGGVAEAGVGWGLGAGAAPGGVAAAPDGVGAAADAGTASAAFASPGCNTSGRAAGIGVGVCFVESTATV